MSRPFFLESTAEERAGWSSEMFKVHLASWLEWEIANAREAGHDLVAQGKFHDATLRAGFANGMSWVLESLNRPVPEEAAPIEEFTDPSAPPPRNWSRK